LSAFPCPVCADRPAARWRFRADDRHCPLCGARVLRLRVGPAAPDGAVWLYLHPSETLRLRLAWERGPEGGPAQTFRPAIDYARSGAHFTADQLGTLEFALEELPGDSPNGDAITVRLRPLFEGLETLPLPAAGAPGQIHLEASTGSEVCPALLLPPPRAVTLTCVEPGVARHDGVWHLHRRGRGVRLAMHLTTAVPLWAGRLRVADDSDLAVTVAGLDAFARLDPDRPHPFELCIDSARWTDRESHHFKCFLDLAALGPMTLTGAVALHEGSRLDIDGPHPRPLVVPLGRARAVSFILSAEADGGAADAVTVVDYAVATEGGAEADWLRVLAPARAALPLVIQSRSPEQLLVEVDARRLDRQRHAGALLHGTVELIDAHRRRWPCAVHATVMRPPPLGDFVAIDWGTTHSCAAHCAGPVGGEPPRALAFDVEQLHTPELFPSDLYFCDISDPQNPVILMGHEAERRARAHPECRLRGVKRLFQCLDAVFVVDEHQRGHTYPTELLAELLLAQLVAQAEAVQGREMHQLALAVPTAWPARLRHKLEGVTQALAARLQRDRRPFAVQVLPPHIDEANAIALHLLTTHHGRALPDTFHLLAYDFGGGGVGTAVLEVHFPEEPAELRTRYVAVGGRADFGGDDVTRAVLLLLHDRLGAALQRRSIVLDDHTLKSARVQEIPLAADGEAPRDGGPGAAHRHHLGRRNWDALWRVAELIKTDLCAAAAEAPPAPPPRPPTAARVTGLADDFTLTVDDDPSFESAIASAFEQEQGGATAASSPLAERLRPSLAEVQCRVLIVPGPAEGGAPVEVVWGLDAVLEPLDDADRRALFEELQFTLDHACEYPLDDAHGTSHGARYNVRQRVEETVRELHWHCNLQGVRPHVAVLAGGGCRLPLLARLLRQYFPEPHDLLLWQQDFAKRRVAHGLASYLALRQVLNLDGRLARAADVLHRPLGLQKMRRADGTLRLAFEVVAPPGAAIDAPAVWHPFAVRAGQLRDADGNLGLTLFVQDWRDGLHEFGYCDLARAAAAGEPGLTAAAVPFAAGATYQGGLRLCGPRRVEVRLALGDTTYGPFAVAVTAADAAALLQSHAS
jgi:hypothetical protein